MKMLSRLFCLVFVLFTVHAWAGNVAYKCTTVLGEIKFLDKKPIEGCATIEVVNISEGVSSNSNGDLEDPLTAQAEQDKKDIAAREIKAKEECSKRKGELEILRSRSQVMITDSVTGEKKALSQEEHQTKIRQYEEYIATLCKEPEPAK